MLMPPPRPPMTDALAFWIAAPGRGEIRREALPAPGPEDVVVRTLYSGVSRGTEALVFHGRVPPEEYQRMRAPYQGGDFPAPVKYGYACAGVVEDGPAALRGRRVFALYPHQTRFVIPAADVHPIPEAVPSRRAVLAANLETALNALWDAPLLPGSRVAVVGGGTVGCLVAWLAGRTPGCEVQLVDVRADRAATAARLGVAFAPAATATADCDVVFHASASGDGLATALGLAGLEATVVELSWYGDAVVPAALGRAFHSRRLTLKSSQVGQVAPAQRPRWPHARRLRLALALLDDPALDVLVSVDIAFDTLPAMLPRIWSDTQSALPPVIRYDASSQ